MRCALALVFAVTLVAAPPCSAGIFSHVLPPSHAKPAPAGDKTAALAAQVRQALDERRYVDAGALLDQALAQGMKSPELITLTGELLLTRGRNADALEVFKGVAGDPTQKARALEGEGLALSLLGRSNEALTQLKAATEADKTLWRAWNGLGAEYDQRRDWKNAEVTYGKALAIPGANTAVVLNNRGYSRLLQQKLTEAASDFVAALEKDPSLAQARTNLRLTLAMEGHYARAVMTGVGDDRAAVLNNVGVAAAMRGDFIEADKLLNQAMEAKGQFYARASENLQMSHDLAARKDETDKDIDATH